MLPPRGCIVSEQRDLFRFQTLKKVVTVHTMKARKITKKEARRLILAYQSLWPPRSLTGKRDAVGYIRRVGCIQFDPLNIVGNNPELVLQARISDFQPAMLQELLYEERCLVDGWDKNMSIYCVEDWPYFERLRQARLAKPGKSPDEVRLILPQIRNAIEEQGPISSIDLGFDQTVDWAWAPTRLARATLESMHMWGELVIHHKVHTRKVYDFAHRYIPQHLLSAADPNKTDEEHQDWRVLRRIGSVGLLWARGSDAWIAMRGIKSKERKAAIARLIEAKKTVEVHVDDIPSPFYMRSDHLGLLDLVEEDCPEPKATVIAPLDNLIWDRRLVEALFDFDYRWEVYKPPKERRYGYYVLPILYGDRFIARFEPGRNRKTGALVIKNWWWENGTTPSRQTRTDLCRCFEHFLSYLGTDHLCIDKKAAGRSSLSWLV